MNNGHIKLFNQNKESLPKYDVEKVVEDIEKELKRLEDDILKFTNMKIEDYDPEYLPSQVKFILL